MSGPWVIDSRLLARAVVRKAAAEALYDGVGFLLQEANKTCPHAEGILEDSGDTDVDREALCASAYYGGEASAYAVVQHEHTEFNHPGKGRAKWLELTLQEQGPRIYEYIGEHMRAAIP